MIFIYQKERSRLSKRSGGRGICRKIGLPVRQFRRF